jgi:protein TonB
MAYSDQKMSGGKIGALVIVALIHVALGYAFVTGLATNFVKKQVEKLNTFDVEEPPPPPPEEPPPPPPDVPMTPPPVVSPPPIVRTPTRRR